MSYTDTRLKEELFERDKTEIHNSEHYVFHFSAGSLAEKEILTIADTQEQCFDRICTTLQVHYPERIHYYLASSPLEIGRVFWEEGTPCNGVALCGSNRIYAVYNETVKCIGSHEDTHLISYLINFPESDFIVEGLAMSMDGLWWGVPNEVWTSYYKNRYPELSVGMLLNNDRFAEWGSEKTYPVAGAFTGFLMDAYGMEQYLELYKYDGCEYEDIFAAVFHSPFAEIEDAFWEKTRKTAFDAFALEEMLRQEGF